MVAATATNADTRDITPAGGIRFTVASRPQRRFSNTQTLSNFAGANSFAPIPLPATGHVRKVGLLFTATYTTSASAAIVSGDGPWNLLSGISISDATGQPIVQPISGYNLYLVNKYLSSGTIDQNFPRWTSNPHAGPDFAFSATGTAGTAQFRLDLDFEQDVNTGYGCIPNLDSNASILLKVDVNPYSVAFSGGTATAATVAVTADQWYWAPVGSTMGGMPVNDQPIGFGDYVETRYETQVVNAASENTVQVNNRGGLIKGCILVSRAAGVRTAYTAGANVGVVLDNNAVIEGIKLSTHQDWLRRGYGYLGADVTTSYAPLSNPISGLDNGVLPFPYWIESGGRDSWLQTKVGSLLQLKVTPGASATQLEIITQIGQVKDPNVFYGTSVATGTVAA